MKKKVDILFIVNQQEDSIFGRRIKMLSKYIYRSFFKVIYRDNKAKIRSIFYFLTEIFKHKPRLVYLEAIAYSGCVAVMLTKPLLRFKLIFCVSDAYSELLKANHNLLIGRIACFFEKLWLKMPDFILTGNPLHTGLLADKYKDKNIDYLEHGVDLDKFRPVEDNEFRKRLKIDGYIVLGLVGSLNWSKRYDFGYGWDIVEAIGYLRDEKVKGLIVGDGNGLAKLKQKAKEFGIIDKIIFTGSIAHEEVPAYINCMDICVSTQSNDPAGFVRPVTKLPEYMACGKYIISSDVGYAKLYVDKVGRLLPYYGVKDANYPKRLAKEIKRIIDNPAILTKGKAGRRIAEDNFDWGKLSKKLERIISCTLEKNEKNSFYKPGLSA